MLYVSCGLSTLSDSAKISATYRKSVVQLPLPDLEAGEEAAPLVRELHHLPPDGLGQLVGGLGGVAVTPGVWLCLPRHWGRDGLLWLCPSCLPLAVITGLCVSLMDVFIASGLLQWIQIARIVQILNTPRLPHNNRIPQKSGFMSTNKNFCL